MDTTIISQYRKQYYDALFSDCIPFWTNGELIDTKYGGYKTALDREGNVYNHDKSVWFQGRCLWTFSALQNRYGANDFYLKAAKIGKKFLEDYCVDTDNRMFFTVTEDGKPLRKRRYMYSESFFVVGMAEYALATKDKDALQKAEDCFELMLRIFKNPDQDPFKITPKSYTSTRSERAVAVPMVLVSSAQLLRRCNPDKADYYSKIADEMTDVILDLHYKEDMKCVLETVGPNGEFIDTPSGRTVNPGHSIENSWFLMNHAIYTGDEDLLAKALNILDWSLELGWDKEHGGFLYFVDIMGKPSEQLEWDMKLWWVHNEVLIASLLAYGLTKNKKYWDWFEKTHEYAFEHFADKKHGEWYGYLHRDGSVSHTLKGSMWKGPFHHPRCLMNCEKILGWLEAGKDMDVLL